ncbi:hypothetical protein FA15DRAFT_671979 [Coprinopsis marcescibilis]|uniref:Uncharacterized protein n=1 Tax=Coprinopsis marcescibilis TaxID=230819 RepID=A0A5C3KPG9_COPMA|nr:hypothetical protein FA15DRAFT_671979 [Coprinopsis marcescibilis]
MSSENVLPWLFETDYSSSVLGGGAVLVIVLLHLAAIAGSGGWTYLWYSSIVDQWNGNTPTETGDQRRFGMSPILFKVYWTLISSVMGVGIGVVAGCVALFSLSGIVGPPLLELTWQASQSVRMFVRRSSGGEEEDQHIYRNFNEWYTSLTLPDFLAYPSPALQMLYTCILVVLGILLYLLAHAMAGALAAGWTLLWFSGLSSIWEVRADLSWYIAPFIVLWGVGACIAMALGTMGCIYILVAFFSPLGGRGHLFLPTPGFNYKRL